MQENQLAELESAPAVPETASDQPPQQPEQAAAPDTPAKTFTQEELDDIVRKRLAKEQRKWERQQRQPAAPPEPKEVPPADQFESVDAYAQALAEKKAQELVEQRELERQQTELLESYAEREESARDKYEDFEQVVYNPNLRVTTVMAQTIQASDIGPDIAYHLGSNPKEAARIANLPPFLQAKEIGRIEAKLVANPPAVKQATKAPEPIAPVTSARSNSPKYDTTDPRSVSALSTSEWIEAERQRQIRAIKARLNA
jgi:hypothetical protein